MPEYNWKDSLDFRFYDYYVRNDVNLIYIDEENPSTIALNFEIRNQSGIEITLEAYNKHSKEPKDTRVEKQSIVSADNFHIELRFRAGTFSAASLVQLDLSEASKEEWLMSRPVFHDNKEVSLYFLKCGRPLQIVDSETTTLTLRGFAANSAGGSRGTNVSINYNKFRANQDKTPISGTKVLNLTILAHRGQRKAPLAICFANQNTILNNGKPADDIELQITNIGGEAIALSPKSEFTIEIDGQAEGRDQPWAVAKKDEAASFSITIKKQDFKESNDRYWYWNVNTSTIDRNSQEPRFTFRDFYRLVGSKQAISSSVNKLKQELELELPKNLNADVIQLKSDIKQTQVAYPGTTWINSSGYSLCFQEDGNFILFNSNKQPLWSTNTYKPECRADTLKFHPNGNLVLYQRGQAIWSTQTQKSNENSQICLELNKNGNFVIYDTSYPDKLLFETKTQGGVQGSLVAVEGWKKSSIDINDSSDGAEVSVALVSDYSFPSNDDLIFVLSNVKSSLASGQGQIRVYYKNIPGYSDGYQVLNLYKTHLIERNKKIGIGKIPDPKIELDVKGTISATEDLNVQGNIKSAKTVSAQSFVGQGAVVKGMIVMWSGNENDIPSGWKICNGQNGTPDLRGRFIVGAGATEHKSFDKPNTHGEPTPHTHHINPPEVQSNTLKAGDHTHNFPNGWWKKGVHHDAEKSYSNAAYSNLIDTNGGDVKGEATQKAGEHVHSVTVKIPEFDSGSSSEEIRPRWYALCFIIYVGKTS